ncbi:hypothetical protein WQ54_19420 [Bacillus sp. SA1-12]|uniref:Panacea domain-containing protein n=1 Tax=Bacillus sp. SA1-12 TaxID=1455638 RepID=UPI0006272881|nr:type II toxin-antitoxin system antitoxin SocA domain-containing protein [Bacillus sp. SA1-12]KKI90691.1 hypothetical protein WQ54_19420 [Bacillus sp. SA1-12]
MASVYDVAKYFISLSEPETDREITHLKLQKLVYYAHAWHIAAYDGDPLVEDDNIEAWIHGPVFPRLYREYRHYGYSQINYSEDLIGNINALHHNEIDIIHVVWEIYGEFSGKYLENLTHTEEPWINAREGHDNFDYGNNVITNDDLLHYYGPLFAQMI